MNRKTIMGDYVDSVQMEATVQSKIDDGDEFLNGGDFPRATELYLNAIALIPDPKEDHWVSLPAYTALGESHFYAGNYDNALKAYRMAIKAPGGVENPLIHLRFGQAYYELGDLNRAADSFTRAYALDGRAVFDREDEKYLRFLGTQIDL